MNSKIEIRPEPSIGIDSDSKKNHLDLTNEFKKIQLKPQNSDEPISLLENNTLFDSKRSLYSDSKRASLELPIPKVPVGPIKQRHPSVVPSVRFDDFLLSLKLRRDLGNQVGRNAMWDIKEKIQNTKFPGISQEELYYYIEAFFAFDIDGNGSINDNELHEALKGLNHDITIIEARIMINKIDQNGYFFLN
jgi:hypothetical protein